MVLDYKRWYFVRVPHKTIPVAFLLRSRSLCTITLSSVAGTIYFPRSTGYHYPVCPGQSQEPPLCHRPIKPGSSDSDRYTCPKCERSYQHLHHMLRHCKFECGSPPRFQCPYCVMRSKQSNNVYKHIRLKHPGLKAEVIVLHYDQQ
ncbi:zinc finger X-chromosomal protein-like [Hylaeus anthracinus]|uniref:zinc finger X-chromosomal protein-like n=1 Tax=Hylaeus anthracinus TaxID=313031 RepID=UPI0023B93795|nr:zinc finger X-chromosomal protein-like [Hylaeus anthracinus]